MHRKIVLQGDKMKEQKDIYIVSLNGKKNTGGVERVVCYLDDILSNLYTTKIIKKSNKDFKKLNNILHPILISLKLYFKLNKFVISNSWQSFLFPADLSIHHGTSKGVILYTRNKKIALKLTALMENISAKLAKKVIAVSENCKNELINYYSINPNKIIVLNNCVDEEQFYPIQKEKKEVITVLFSGSLSERKGLSQLVLFSDFLEQNDVGIELKIATNTDSNNYLFQGRKKTSIYSDVGFDKMCEFYQSGDVLYFPTLYEGFSMSTLEALSTGIPVIGSKFAIMPELEKYDFCKIIEKEAKIEELTNEIKYLYSNYKDKKEYIHEIIANDFGKKQYYSKVLDIINQV